MVQFLDPKIAKILQFLDPEIVEMNKKNSGSRNRRNCAVSGSRNCKDTAVSGSRNSKNGQKKILDPQTLEMVRNLDSENVEKVDKSFMMHIDIGMVFVLLNWCQYL